MAEPTGREVGRRILDAIRGYVARSLHPVVAKVNALESQLDVILKGEGGQVTIKGEPGVRGEKGEPGERGPQGEKGESGERGLPGERGEKGEPGAPGAAGAPGKSAFELAVERGFDGTEEQWLASLRGKDGAPGPRGEPGEPGAAGARGERGEKGDAGNVGKDGRDGRDGKDGAPGRDGKDALELDILPAIDETRTYPRGTFARHANGLWRSVSNTQGMRGWECIVAGVAAVTIGQRDERFFALSVHLSDGTAVDKGFVLPVVLDRGVYRPESQYSKGDGVTWAGSWWIAQVDEPTDKPGTSEQWRLAVKRGRDGKDAK